MSDEKKPVQDEELDKVSGGVGTHPIPIDPIRPGAPRPIPAADDPPSAVRSPPGRLNHVLALSQRHYAST